MIRAGYASPSRLFIVPIQDLLSLGSEARMNTPGQAVGNWQWRLNREQLDDLWGGSAAYLQELAKTLRSLTGLNSGFYVSAWQRVMRSQLSDLGANCRQQISISGRGQRFVDQVGDRPSSLPLSFRAL